jgi:transcriptional regulator of arginine metabolism
MGKKERLDKIKEIIVSFNIGSQDELLNALQSNGFNLTQATLSRDLKQLKVAKIPTASGYRYSLSSKVVEYGRGKSVQNASESLPGGIISIDFTGPLGVIKTSPGFASALAWSIDNYADNRILGTIAGDDTIFLAINENTNRHEIMALLSEMFPDVKLNKYNF